LCTRPEGYTFDQKTFLDGTCPRCGGITLLYKCIHVSDEYELGRKEVSLKNFKYVTYDIDGGKERKAIQLVTSQVRVCDFMKEFIENKGHYVARWKDEHFRICKDTFHVATMLSWLIFLRTTPFNCKMRFKSNIITQSRST
jgi:hypothetical protein